MKPSALSILMPVSAIMAVLAIGLNTHVSRAATAPSFATDSLASPAAPGATTPNLTVAADGKVYMSWLEPADSGHALRFSVLENRAWSEPRTIRSGRDFFVNWADFSSIQVLDGGRLAAHWL